jgi:HAD superfamily hydrolase (TIGR01509 family)
MADVEAVAGKSLTGCGVEAVCFDLDGTMFNTEHLFFEAGDTVLRKYDRRMTLDVMDVIIGRRPMESFILLVDYLGIDVDPMHLLEISREAHHALISEKLAPMPGVVELLETLAARGIPCAVTTSSPRDYAETLVEQSGLTKHFRFFLTSADVVQGKPHPEIYLKAANTFGVRPERMAVLEDSAAGTRAAVLARTRAIAVPHEFTAAHDFTGAELRVETLTDRRVYELLAI